jgi:hypothetical protein
MAITLKSLKKITCLYCGQPMPLTEVIFKCKSCGSSGIKVIEMPIVKEPGASTRKPFTQDRRQHGPV